MKKFIITLFLMFLFIPSSSNAAQWEPMQSDQSFNNRMYNNQPSSINQNNYQYDIYQPRKEYEDKTPLDTPQYNYDYNKHYDYDNLRNRTDLP